MDIIDLSHLDPGFAGLPEGTLTQVGYLGAGLYLLAYTLLKTGVLNGSSYSYTFLNLFAAAFVAISLIEAFNAASLIIQAAWITISLVGLSRRLLSRSLRVAE
ncbi:MAG: cyclic nucleotide-binding protein [Pseudomonadota bacterium]